MVNFIFVDDDDDEKINKKIRHKTKQIKEEYKPINIWDISLFKNKEEKYENYFNYEAKILEKEIDELLLLTNNHDYIYIILALKLAIQYIKKINPDIDELNIIYALSTIDFDISFKAIKELKELKTLLHHIRWYINNSIESNIPEVSKLSNKMELNYIIKEIDKYLKDFIFSEDSE
jgi:hypothetical protein